VPPSTMRFPFNADRSPLMIWGETLRSFCRMGIPARLFVGNAKTDGQECPSYGSGIALRSEALVVSALLRAANRLPTSRPPLPLKRMALQRIFVQACPRPAIVYVSCTRQM
jgi:hypothetical protein